MATDVFEPVNNGPDQNTKRDRYGRYLLPEPGSESGKHVPWTRATTFNKTIADTFALNMWNTRMAVKGVAITPELLALAAATPLSDRDKLNEIAEDAKRAAGSKASASLGTALHSFTEQHDRGETVTVPEQWAPDVAAYAALCTSHGLVFRPEWIERVTVVPEFGVAGTFDRIATVTRPIVGKVPGLGTVTLDSGDNAMYDLKTGRDLSYGWGEIAVQLALYAHGEALWNKNTSQYEPMPPVRRDVGLVVHLPVGQSRAELYMVNLVAGREAMDLCSQVRAWRSRARKLAAPVGEVTAGQTVTSNDTSSTTTWEDRIRSCQSSSELSAVRKAAMARGEWTDKLLKAGLGRVQQITAQ